MYFHSPQVFTKMLSRLENYHFNWLMQNYYFQILLGIALAPNFARKSLIIWKLQKIAVRTIFLFASYTFQFCLQSPILFTNG